MKMKRKGIILASAILGSVAVVSTGFAAWVITSNQVTATPTGNILVETVSSESYSIDVKWVDKSGEVDTEQNISFGGNTAETTYHWLSFSGNYENLTERFYVTASKTVKEAGKDDVVTTITSGSFTVSLDIGKMDGDKWVSSLANFTSEEQKYITLPTFNDSYSVASVTKDAPVAVSFGWGDAFKPEGEQTAKNPYEYFNSKAYTAELGAEADQKLTGLYNLTNGLQYKLTITYTA